MCGKKVFYFNLMTIWWFHFSQIMNIWNNKKKLNFILQRYENGIENAWHL